jgi:hypothetical protein
MGAKRPGDWSGELPVPTDSAVEKLSFPGAYEAKKELAAIATASKRTAARAHSPERFPLKREGIF